MFARFKTADGKEINVVPYRVIGLAEEDGGTTIFTETGFNPTVVGSIRQVRSTLNKVGQPAGAICYIAEEAGEASNA